MSQERPGDVIGRYKLLQELGEGGFGVVYQAEQTKPVRRHVALKIIKLGMDTKQVVARFEVERQALALMDHPNIAKVLDAGATKSGRPYFVMELVRGVPITDYCDQAKLDVAARLDLFVQVCHAVQHAHQKGIIHRDLKPNNILIALHDGRAVPTIIDFGIAKATRQQLTDKTLLTELHQWIGTPEYMAPEQAGISGLDIDTRADIYSLGVLLYELLTGTTPFDAKDLMRGGYEKLLRAIREKDPPKPSVRVGGRRRGKASKRGGAQERAGELRGELDWIAMKALDKDRARRYESANGLALDVQRYVAGEPVAAGPPGGLYRMQRYMRRNRVSVGVGAGVLLALVSGTALAVTGYVQAADQRDHAKELVRTTKLDVERAAAALAEEERERERAEREEAAAELDAARAREVLQLTDQMLGAANPTTALGRDYTVRELLADFERDIGDRLKDQPQVEATIRAQVAQTYRGLGLPDRSEPHLQRALELRRDTLGSDHEEYAYGLADLALLRRQQSRFREAEEVAREALAISLDRHGPDHVITGNLRTVLAQVLLERGLFDSAEQEANAALSIYRQADPQAPVVGRILGVLATLELARGDFPAATERANEAIALQRRVFGEDHPETAASLSVLGSAELQTLGAAAAVRTCRRVIEILRENLRPGHPRLATPLSNLAVALRKEGRLDEAAEAYREAIAIQTAAFGERHVARANILANMAFLDVSAGRFADADAKLEEASQIAEESLGARHPQLASIWSRHAEALRMLGRPEDAHALAERALRLAMDVLGREHHATATCLNTLGMTQVDAGLFAEAEASFHEAIAIDTAARGEDHLDVLSKRGSLALAYERQGKYGLAQQIRQENLRTLEAKFGDDGIFVNKARLELAQVMHLRGNHRRAERITGPLVERVEARLRPDHPNLLVLLDVHAWIVHERDPDEAEAIWRRVLEGRKRELGHDHPETAATWNRLGVHLRQEGRFDEAEEALRNAVRIWSESLRDDHPRTMIALANLALTLQASGDPRAALPHNRTVLANLRRVLDENDPRVTAALSRLGWTLLLVGEHAEAAEIATELLEHERTAESLGLLGQTLVQRGRHEEAEPCLRESLALQPDHGSLARLCEALLLQRKYSETTPLLRECVRLRSEQLPDSWLLHNAMSMLGESLTGQGEFDEAESLLLEAWEHIAPPPYLAWRRDDAGARIVKLYEAWGKPEEAARWRAKLAPPE